MMPISAITTPKTMNQPEKRRAPKRLQCRMSPASSSENPTRSSRPRAVASGSIDSGRLGIDDCAPASTAALTLANTRSIWRRMTAVGGADRIHHARGPRDQLQRRGKDHERERQQQPALIREQARGTCAEPPGDADDGCAESERDVRPRVGRAERQDTPGYEQDRAGEHSPADRVEGRPVPSAAIRVVGHQQGWAPDPAAGRRESSARADA